MGPTMNQKIGYKDESDKREHSKDGGGKTKTTHEPIDKTKGLALKDLGKLANELKEIEVVQKWEDLEEKEKLRQKNDLEKPKAEKPTTNKQTRDNSQEVTVEATTENLIGIDMTKDPINETKGESTEYIERSFKDVIEKSNKDLEEKGQVESVQPTMNQEIRSNNKSDKKAHFKDGDGKTKTTDEPIDKTKGLVNMGLEKSGNESEEGEVDQKLEDAEGKESGKHKAGKPTTNKQTRYNIKNVTVEAATKNLIGIYIPEDQINKRKGESKEDLEQSFKNVIEKSINDLEEKEQVDSVEPTMNQEIRSKDESDKTAHFNDGDGKTKTTDEPIDKTKGLATKGLEKSANELEEREVDQKLEDSEGKGKLRHKKESEKNKAENPTTNKQTRNDLKEILLKSTTNNLRGINIPEDPIYETKGESTEELEQSFKYVIEKSNN